MKKMTNETHPKSIILDKLSLAFKATIDASKVTGQLSMDKQFDYVEQTIFAHF